MFVCVRAVVLFMRKKIQYFNMNRETTFWEFTPLPVYYMKYYNYFQLHARELKRQNPLFKLKWWNLAEWSETILQLALSASLIQATGQTR